MYARRKTMFMSVVGLVVLLLMTAWTVFASNDYERGIAWTPGPSPEGTWIIAMPTPAGNDILTFTLIAQGSGGTRFTTLAEGVNHDPTFFGMLPGADSMTQFVGPTIRTGLNSYQTSLVVYKTQRIDGPAPKIVWIVKINLDWQITGENAMAGAGTFSAYSAQQDTDTDGFPDEGQEPLGCVPFTLAGTRVCATPGCTPTPAPSQG